MKTKTNNIEIRNYNYELIPIVMGGKYSAMGVCGMGDGVEVIGNLTEITDFGSILEDAKGQPYLVNTRTLKCI